MCARVLSCKKRTLSHPPYSPDLVPLDNHLFSPVRKYFSEKEEKNCSDEMDQRTVQQNFMSQGYMHSNCSDEMDQRTVQQNFMRQGYMHSIKVGTFAMERNGDYVKK